MSQLTREDIIKLADLAKIEMTAGEEEKYLKDINNILSHISMVTEAKIDNTDRKFTFVNNTREDILEERDFDLQTIFTNVPQKTADNYVKVSKVIKK